MTTRITHFYLFLLYMLVYRDLAKGTKISCLQDRKTHVVDISTDSAKRNATRVCIDPEKVSLLDEDILILSGEVDVEFLAALLRATHVEMCISVENSDLVSINIYAESVTGYCNGPKIRFVGNPKLEYIFTVGSTFSGAVPPDLLRIRGNKMFNKKFLEAMRKRGRRRNASWDLQTFGECALPMPFISLESLDRNCTKFYGTLVMNQGTTEIEYDPLNVQKFELEGCIQIEKTNLKDISFLNAFSRFRPIPFCSQYIRNNKNLCYKNLNFLNTLFKTITFTNNSEQPCEKCMGGEVSEGYLNESVNCSTVYGDLVIADQRGLPWNIGNLRGIETIDGRLIITNNTGLNKFVYLSSLKKVGRNENGAAVIARDNADLKLLHLPVLENIKIKKGENRVELANNPMLSEHMEQMQEVNEEALGKSNTLKKTDFAYAYTVFGGIAVVLVSLSLIVSFGLFFRQKQRRNKIILPNPPYALSTKSQEQLISLCKEIVTRNPMVWCVEDFAANWKQAHDGDNECALSKPAQFVKSHIIPAARNAGISQRRGADEKIRQNRMQELLEYDWIIMTATVNDVTKTAALLPCNIGSHSVYKDGVAEVTYKLLEITQLSSKISCYLYKAEDINQHTTKKIVLILYHWPHERLPTEYSELLQLITLLKAKKGICTSNRRKEVFSLLYVLYATVIDAKGPKNFTEVFNLHSRFCNGAPLDRHEVLYVMKFLLEWAKCTNCVPGKIEKEHARWCQTYDHMAEFSRKHPNIVSIHPSHLIRLDGFEKTRKEVEHARIQVMSLSERPPKEMVDRFRRKTPEEIQRELIYATKSTYGGVQSVSTSTDSNIHNTYNSATPSQETDCSMKGAVATGRDSVHFKQ